MQSTTAATVSIPQAVWIACNKLVYKENPPMEVVSIPQAVWIACNDKMDNLRSIVKLFQYRKRYGLHAMEESNCRLITLLVFQYRKRYGLHAIKKLQMQWQKLLLFQYRKRYGLHAILSPGSLGNSEPRSRFSDTDPLFAFFPKVRGTFLSRKVLRKGLEASHSKGTFVHERNLILMAFSLDFRASLEQSIS